MFTLNYHYDLLFLPRYLCDKQLVSDRRARAAPGDVTGVAVRPSPGTSASVSRKQDMNERRVSSRKIKNLGPEI